jgi:hypothetical protein
VSAGIVLLYHRIAAVERDPQRLCVSPGRFAEQLDALREGGDVVPLGEVFGGRGRPRVAVTFDDGYVDNLTAALPALRSAGVPATFFITAGMVGSDVMFWWEDMVLNEEHSDVPPDEARSGTGAIMEMTAPDDLTAALLDLARGGPS